MVLKEKERTVIEDLQTQEKACVDKYRFYEQSAHDEELKNLFHRIGDEEQEHFDSLGMVLKGDVPNVSAARSGMEGYTPSESYAAGNNSEEKKHDQFLCTDCIATEKLVSSTYNDDVFRFLCPDDLLLLYLFFHEPSDYGKNIFGWSGRNHVPNSSGIHYGFCYFLYVLLQQFFHAQTDERIRNLFSAGVSKICNVGAIDL